MTPQHQTSLDFGRTRGTLGAERAAAKADRIAAGWIEQAIAALHMVAVGFGRRAFTMETARYLIERRLPRPDGVDGRVWGAVTRAALRAKIITKVPGLYEAAISSNGSPKPCYRKGIKA